MRPLIIAMKREADSRCFPMREAVTGVIISVSDISYYQERLVADDTFR
jgi:hypothetical protein